MSNNHPFGAFMIVDDDPVNNFICRNVITTHVKDPVPVLDFTEPEKALEHIATRYVAQKNPLKTLLFLDINTATLSAWEFLERFSALEDEIRNMFSIYIISSSVDVNDEEKALSSRHVKGFLVKPISHEALGKIL